MEGARATPAAGGAATRSTFKPRDVEELVDWWINRPLAGVLVRALAPLPISPNQVTVLSGISGLAGGIVVGTASVEDPWQVPLGGLLLFLSILFDCADGQLARLRGVSSMLGRALDGFVDVIPTAAMFVGFAVFLWRSGHDFLYLNLLGWAAGYSMKFQTHAYDHAKNIFLSNVQPPEQRSSSLPSFEEIEQERQNFVQQGRPFAALVIHGFALLTRSQRTGWQKGRIGIGLPGARTEAERLEYRERFRGTMRLWTFNGLATHLLLFLAACAATPFYREAALVAWAVMLVPMNVMTACLIAAERRIERELQGRFFGRVAS